MTSVVDNVSRIFQAKNNGLGLQVPTVFSSIFLQQAADVDLMVDQISLEVFKGNREVAPLISRITGGNVDNKVITPGQVGVSDYLYGLIEQELKLNAGTLNKRIPGENPFEPMDKDARMMYWMQELLMGAKKRVLRKLELLAQQSFNTGEMDLGDTHEGETKLIFPVDAALKNRPVAVSWATAASATPWADYGSALRETISLGQVIANAENVFSIGSYTAIENLKAIYRNQRSSQVEDSKFFDYSFNNVTVPASLQFLVENGAIYVGWIRTDFGQNPVHVFTTAGMYDNGASTVDYVSGETVSLCVYSPDFFKAYFGAGTKLTPDESFYTKTFGDFTGELGVEIEGLTVGNAKFPTESFMPNVFPLAKNEGVGGSVQIAPIFARMQVNCVSTIDTLTV